MSRSNTDNVESSITELYNRETEYGTALDDDATREHAYKMKKAEKFLAAEGTEKAREAQSVIDSGKEFLAHLKSKAVKEFTREKLKDSQQALSARQSILSSGSRSDQGYANDKRIT